MRTNLVLKIGLTLMTLYYVYVPASADIGDSHLHSAEWSDHSRVHLVWFLVFTALVGAVGVRHRVRAAAHAVQSARQPEPKGRGWQRPAGHRRRCRHAARLVP